MKEFFDRLDIVLEHMFNDQIFLIIVFILVVLGILNEISKRIPE